MKRIFLVVFAFAISYIGISQSIVQRSTSGNTVQDARLSAQYNLFIPKYADTAAARTPPGLGLDTCGAVIYTYDVDALWFRSCYPYKHWEKVGTGASLPQLPDGLYSGGDVAWTGTGLTFNVTPAVYILGGVAYTSPASQVTLPAADPTFTTIDYIILDTTGGANVIQGVPSANPQQPTLNPQTQIGRAFVTVPANSPIPLITTSIIYDENLGTPTEWDATSTGTVLFGNTNFPYHLTIAAAASNFVANQYISFTYTDTVNSSPRGNLVAFIRLAGAMTTFQNFNINLLYQGNVVGQTISATAGGLDRGRLNSYQALVFPMPLFSPGNLIFDEVRFTAVGGATFPQFNLDYIQFQTGVTPITIIPDQRFGVSTGDNFANSDRSFDFNTNSFNFNNVGKFLVHFPSGSVSDSIFSVNVVGSNPILRVSALNNSVYVSQLDAGNGTFNVNPANATIGNGHGLLLYNNGFTMGYQQPFFIQRSYPNTGVTTFLKVYNVDTINASGADSAGIKIISGAFQSTVDNIEREKFFVDARGAIWDKYTPHAASSVDSILIKENGYIAYRTKAELGIGGTVTSVATNTATGITGGTITTTGTLAIDTTIIATRLYVNNQVTTYFNSNVGSGFRIAIPTTNNIKTLLSGYALTWDSATSNSLKITVDTTLMATRAYVGAAGGAGTVSSFSFSNANGISGVVTNQTTTPQLTLSTSVNGVVKANGTAFSAATSGTDYSAGTSALATGILKSTTGTGALSIAVANTDYVTPSVTTLSSLTTTGTLTSGSISTGFIVRGVTMTLGSDASFDMYYRSAGGVLTRLANGTTGQFLGANTGAAPTWQSIASTITINSSAIVGGTAGRILFQNAANQVSQSANLFWDNTNSRLGIGTAAPTALLQLAAGTAAVAPFKLTAGTNLTTPAAGAFEFDGTNFYLDPSTTRKRIPLTNNVTPANGQIPIGNGVDYTVANITPQDNGTKITNGAGSITIGENSAFQTLTSAATITWNAANGYNANITLANVGATLNITNPVDGRTYMLVITQDGTGSRTITTWPAGTLWPSGTAPVLSTVAGAINVVMLTRRGTGYIGKAEPNRFQ